MGRPNKSDLTPSRDWGLASLKSIGVGPAQIAVYDLVCRTTMRAHRMVIYSGTKGIGLPISGSFTNDEYTYFHTSRPMSFANFDGASVTTSSTSLIVYSWSTVTFYDSKLRRFASVKSQGTGVSFPELGSGGLGSTEIHYGNGRPVEIPDWIVSPDLSSQDPHRSASVRRVQTVQDRAHAYLLPGDMLFEFDKSEIHWQANQALSDAGYYIMNNASIYKRIVIEGHTDNFGGHNYNQELSTKRAQAVRAWLGEYIPDPLQKP